MSIRDRINAFSISGKTDHLGRAPITANQPNGKIPERPAYCQRSQTTDLITNHPHNPSNGIGNEPNGPRRDGVLPPPTNITRTGQVNQKPAKPAPPPRLPPRRETNQPSPALPPRRPSHQLSRKASNESISSTISTISTISDGTSRTTASRAPSVDHGRIKAPVYDQDSLPPLPPKRTKDQIEARYSEIEKAKAFPAYKEADARRASFEKRNSIQSVATIEISPAKSQTPALPPRTPARPEKSSHASRKLPPPAEKAPPKPSRSALSFGMNRDKEPAPSNGTGDRDPSPKPFTKTSAPPPIPINSRPDLSKLHATKPQSATAVSHPQYSSPSTQSPCLLCRDFSGVDSHASMFPRESVPSLDWLASQLTDPFPSPTDKARSIFTWLHHNIAYDTVSFFNGNLQPSTPISTMHSGLAVCEGYAALFTALATKVGLESMLVSGHGKGYGFASLAPGSPLPAENPTGHAWNAVKIDGGYWKLIDPCWGAGNVNGKGQPYNKHFSPRQFTMSNPEFGLRHFPKDKRQFFVDRPPTWQDYILGPLGGAESVRVYSGVAADEGVSETSFLPSHLHVPISPSSQNTGPTVRFQFSRICEHWDPQHNGKGKPYTFILQIHGVDGREKDYVPFETNGMFWWVDIEPKRLGAKGQTVSAYTVETVGGVTARGLSVEEYRAAKGRKGMGFGGLAAWELV